MIKRAISGNRLLLLTAVLCIEVSGVARGSDRLDTNQKEVTLNRLQVAALDIVFAEMRRRGWKFYRKWQTTITDKGDKYEIAFFKDPFPKADLSEEGLSWEVRKRDLKLFGPTLYR